MNLLDFLRCDPMYLNEFWTEHRLPHPGCPASLKMVCNLVWCCHRMNVGDPLEKVSWYQERKKRIKECTGQVWFISLNGRVAVFDFPYKDKHLLVPLDINSITDFQLLDYILKGCK